MRDVVVHIMHRNRCASRRRIRHFSLRAGKTKTFATAGINAYSTGCAVVRSAASTFDGVLPVCVVGLVASGQRRISCRGILLRRGVAAFVRVRENCGYFRIKVTYVAHREDTVGFWPLGYATVRGLRIILPPQARPTQPRELGATTWSTTS